MLPPPTTPPTTRSSALSGAVWIEELSPLTVVQELEEKDREVRQLHSLTESLLLKMADCEVTIDEQVATIDEQRRRLGALGATPQPMTTTPQAVPPALQMSASNEPTAASPPPAAALEPCRGKKMELARKFVYMMGASIVVYVAM